VSSRRTDEPEAFKSKSSTTYLPCREKEVTGFTGNEVKEEVTYLMSQPTTVYTTLASNMSSCSRRKSKKKLRINLLSKKHRRNPKSKTKALL
jgi:hypothetical protein